MLPQILIRSLFISISNAQINCPSGCICTSSSGSVLCPGSQCTAQAGDGICSFSLSECNVQYYSQCYCNQCPTGYVLSYSNPSQPEYQCWDLSDKSSCLEVKECQWISVSSCSTSSYCASAYTLYQCPNSCHCTAEISPSIKAQDNYTTLYVCACISTVFIAIGVIAYIWKSFRKVSPETSPLIQN